MERFREKVLKARQERKGDFPKDQDGTPDPIQALRKLCRDEPTLGSLFHVFEYSSVNLAGCNTLLTKSPLWLVARPLIDGKDAPIKDYLPIATRNRPRKFDWASTDRNVFNRAVFPTST